MVKRKQTRRKPAVYKKRKRYPLVDLVLVFVFLIVVATIVTRPWEKWNGNVNTPTTSIEDKKNLRGTASKSGFDMDWLLYLVLGLVLVGMIFFVYTSEISMKIHFGEVGKMAGSLETWGSTGYLDRMKAVLDAQVSRIRMFYKRRTTLMYDAQYTGEIKEERQKIMDILQL